MCNHKLLARRRSRQQGERRLVVVSDGVLNTQAPPLFERPRGAEEIKGHKVLIHCCSIDLAGPLMKPESPDLELLRISRASTVSWDFPFYLRPRRSQRDAIFSGPLLDVGARRTEHSQKSSLIPVHVIADLAADPSALLQTKQKQFATPAASEPPKQMGPDSIWRVAAIERAAEGREGLDFIFLGGSRVYMLPFEEQLWLCAETEFPRRSRRFFFFFSRRCYEFHLCPRVIKTIFSFCSIV